MFVYCHTMPRRFASISKFQTVDQTRRNGAIGALKTSGHPVALIAGTLEQMTKQQLVEAVSVKTGRETAEVENVLEAALWSIAEALSSNERVDLRGFGSFTVKNKKERQGRNPRTGETITIAAKRDASFKPGKELTEKLILPKTEAKPA